jgi:hypothetical protein
MGWETGTREQSSIQPQMKQHQGRNNQHGPEMGDAQNAPGLPRF